MLASRSRLFNLLGAALGATVSAASTSTRTFRIQWGACDPSVITDPELSCAFFEVPLDYHDVSVGTAKLALAKANATSEPRLGTIFYNPGGPGGSGLETLDGHRDYFLKFTGGHYDFVTWDPRGVGISSPGDIKCFDSLEDFQEFFNGTIQAGGIEYLGNFTNQGDIDALFAQAESFQQKYEEAVRLCMERNGDTLKYLGTSATVRDMVAMADALDGPDSPINFYGASYGTFLANVFMNMFPKRVGRVVIDGIVNPLMWSRTELSLNWEKSYLHTDDVYKGFITGCALSGPAGCPISTEPGQTPSEVNDLFQDVLKQAHDTALANTSAPLSSGIIRLSYLVAMYQPSGWMQDAAAWLTIKDIVESESTPRNPSSLVGRDVLDFLGRTSSQMGKRQDAGNQTLNPSFALPAIACSDSLTDMHSRTTMKDVFSGIVDATHNISHMFGGAFPINLYFCSFWPIRSVERYDGYFNSTQLENKILVLGNTFDPVTPFEFAQGVAESYGDQAALVRFDAFGHSTAGEFASQCVFQITQAYYTNGTLPNGNSTVCEANEDFEIFPGVNTQAILAKLPSVDF